MVRRKIFMPVMAAVVSTLVLLGGVATAATAPTTGPTSATNNGLKVSPVRTDLTINPGKSQTISVFVTNVTGGVASYKAVINDFTADSSENGQPAILLDDNKTAGSHSLKKFLTLDKQLTLKARETKEIKVTIAIPAGAAAGGYYGAVRFEPTDTAGQAGKNVTLSASVGSLVLVKVPGNVREQMVIVSLDARKAAHNNLDSPKTIFTSNTNLNGVVRFQNNGDVQEEPFGKLLVKDMHGKTLGEYEINNTDPRGNVLPGSIRKFELPLKNLGTFGKYTLEGNFGYGTDGQLLSAKTTFYIIPISVLLLAAVVVLFILFLIFGLPRLIRAYNRRVLQNARRRR